MIMKKRFGTLTLALAMACSLAIPAGAIDSPTVMQTDATSERLIRNDGSFSDATIADVDELTRQRTQAVFNEDEILAEELLEQLEEIGGRPSTKEEIALFADSHDISPYAATKSTNFLTYTYSSTVNGTTYSIKRIDNVASTSSNLYHSGVIAKKTSAGKAATAFEICKVVGTALAGAANTTVGNALNVYSVLSGTAAAVSSTTVVRDITASYTYQIQEHCSFYSYKNSSGSWVPFAVSSYADTVVTTVLTEMTLSNGTTSTLNNYASTYKNTLYLTNSKPNEVSSNVISNTSNLLTSYLSSYTVNSQSRVLSATIYSDGSNVVRHIGLVAPTTTSEIN